MINFNKDSIFNLHPIELDKVREEATGLLIEGEELVAAFKTIRDQLVFTNKRIISIDVQGLTGMRRSYSSLPYSKIQFFGVQTAGFLELVPDAELMLTFANGSQACFDFKGNVDIGRLCRVISEYVLEDRRS